jgi:hypothetical protein
MLRATLASLPGPMEMSDAPEVKITQCTSLIFMGGPSTPAEMLKSTGGKDDAIAL